MENPTINARDIACVVWSTGVVAVYRGWSAGRAEVVGVFDDWAHYLRAGLPSDWGVAPRVRVVTVCGLERVWTVEPDPRD